MASRPSTSSLAPISLATLSDPPIKLIDGAAFDYFLIEMASTLRESAAFATARTKRIEAEMLEAGLIPAATPAVTQSISKKAGGGAAGPRDSVTSLSSTRGGKSTSSSAAASAVDEEDEPLRARLETIGMHVGTCFAERLCAHRPPFDDTLEVMKFICKDVWVALFDKQVDNLRTNRRGMFQLSDALFKPIQRVSSYLGRGETIKKARLYATLPAGIIRGILATMGYSGTVVPEITSVPQCTLKVNIKLPKSEM
ncbi:trafficking protein particle complex subunit 6B [Ephemerocybe angulata]|uniref:Trafficking protein particle complex subunit 6B n=1 Tax=Ephemerocybe angulata TaxID=980116 RepID=A0A8H6I6K0_9AGAR|nr:trafficking protein particle complex subunit 6B [Tulosesus angulatus]